MIDRKIFINCAPEEKENTTFPCKVICKIDNPVEFFGLDVKVEMKFRGADARNARRCIFDFLRNFKPLFAGFNGPKDPIMMSFYCRAGNQAIDTLDMLMSKHKYEDLEINLKYYSLKNSEHKGQYQTGKRKHSIRNLFNISKDTGQTKLEI